MSSRSISGRGLRRRGTALVIVLWISLGLASMALYFGHAMKMEYRAAANTASGLQASQAIEGAARYMKYALINLLGSGEPFDPEVIQTEAVEVGQGLFWAVGRDPRDLDYEEQAFGLIDESSKLNLNSADLEQLLLLPRMTSELAGAIVDWRDEDQEISANGAEDAAYSLRDPPRRCKNAAFESLEELRLVVGADWEILYGEDVNRNGVLDPNENDGDASPPDDNSDGRLDPGIVEYLTVYSREPNTTSDGGERINLTQNSFTELARLLEETFDEQRASEIIGNLGSATSFGSVLEFSVAAQLESEELALIEDSLTVEDGEWIVGRVNVNSASEAVLICIPGIGEDFAGDLIAHREDLVEELDSVAWVAEILDPEAVALAGPYLTTASYQYSADIVGVGEGGRGFRRTLFVFDTTQGEAITLYRRDRARLGWPLGESVRAELALLGAEGGRGQ